MLRVGLTGGTGSGKSTVAGRLAARGAVVVDADALAREVVAPGSEGLVAVAAEFGDGVLAPDRSLDRPALGRLVFADARRREALEAITHPRIAALTRERFAAAPADAVVVHDVPLLVEKAMGARYHLVVVVDAPEPERVRRLVGRGMGEADARSRIAVQADEGARRAAADVWLDNAGSAAEVRARVDALWDDRLVPFEANLRAGVPAPRPQRVTLAAPDPTWPAQAERVLARVRAAVGDAALSLEHVGSTAVPGLRAKDVLDLQLVVADLDVAAALSEPLRDAGLPAYTGDWWDDEPQGPAPKRMHGSADPGRAVNLHVRAPGRSSREATRFRDWLRADAEERDAYAAVKAAGEGNDIEAYVEAKAPWVRAAIQRSWGCGGG